MANSAVRILASGDARVVETSIPDLPADDYILVKTTAVALNPTDWKHVDMAQVFGCVGAQVGCDYAGVVEHVGPAVSKPFKKGDRICGPVNGSNGSRSIDGSFAKYICVKGDLQIQTPDCLTDEQAATLGIAVTTVGQGLYQNLQLAMPNAPKPPKGTPILIYGGSTAMGIFGIQYAKLSGYDVVATSSPHNFDYVKSLGADAVFDYKSPSCAADIKAWSGDRLKLAWDCQSTEESATICAQALCSSEPSKIGTLLDVSEDKLVKFNALVKTQSSLYYTVFGEPFTFIAEHSPVPENYEFGKSFWELSKTLLGEGKIQPIKIIKNQGGEGLDGVLAGLQYLKEGRVSASKLVYTL